MSDLHTRLHRINKSMVYRIGHHHISMDSSDLSIRVDVGCGLLVTGFLPDQLQIHPSDRSTSHYLIMIMRSKK